MNDMQKLYESAAKLQEVAPDAVLVGGSAAAFYAHHRMSFDHDHVIEHLQSRYDAVLEAVVGLDGWSTNPRASRPPMTIMGSLDGYQAGLRNLRRKTPLEVETVELPNGSQLQIPTIAEVLRTRAFLIVQRNQVRDYLDVAAVGSTLGISTACEVLKDIDSFYSEFTNTDGSVLSELVYMLSAPNPADSHNKDSLGSYKGVVSGWDSWSKVESVCKEIAACLT